METNHRADVPTDCESTTVRPMAETAENASPTDKKLSKSLQFELALLWRTLDMIRNIDEDAVVAFYDSLVVSLRSVPALSLSSYWDKKHGTHTSIVGVVRARDEVAHVAKSLIVDPVDDSANGDVAVVGAGHSSSENGAFAVDIKLPELEYLTEDGRAHDEHDPLGLVRNLFYTAATHLARATSAKHINTLLNSLLTIAIKSGRASLLLYICILIANAGGDAIELDMNLLVELNDVIESKQDGEHSGKDEFTNEKLSSILFYSSTANVSDNCEKVGGILLSFGKADHGKLGHGDMQLHRLIPTVVEALVDVDVVKMASMSTYALALDSHGSVYVWGTGGSAGSGNVCF